MYLWKMKELVLADTSSNGITYAGRLAHMSQTIGVDYDALKGYVEGNSLTANVGRELIRSIKSYSRHYANVTLIEHTTPLLGERIHMWIREHRIPRAEIISGTGMTTQWVTVATKRVPPSRKFLKVILPIIRMYDSGNYELISLIESESNDTRANSIHFSFRDDWCTFVEDILSYRRLTVVTCAKELGISSKTLGDCISGRISPSRTIQVAITRYVPRNKRHEYEMLCNARDAAYTETRVRIVSEISRKLFAMPTMDLARLLQGL